ncbi:MAG TPA: hypothetical protein VLG47_02740 [Candidatus Saccharimonadales bacterium]|nr:hypothetical protein [Candidatus Saccharimonadales bacterium]
MYLPEKFPFAPLTADDKRQLIEQFGGTPANPQLMGGVLLKHGENVLAGDSHLWFTILAGILSRNLPQTDYLTRPSIYIGGLFYLSCADIVGGFEAGYPDYTETLQQFCTADLINLKSKSRIRIEEDHRRLHDLAAEFRSGLVIIPEGEERLHRHVMLGAGVMHLATLQAVGLERII